MAGQPGRQVKWTIQCGFRRLAFVAGLAGPSEEGVDAYAELSRVWQQRAAHQRFETFIETPRMKKCAQGIKESQQSRPVSSNVDQRLPQNMAESGIQVFQLGQAAKTRVHSPSRPIPLRFRVVGAAAG